MDDFKINSLSGRIESIYITFIKNTKTKKELDNIKNLYIIKNPFVLVNEKQKYLGYINILKKQRYLAHIFITNVRKIREKIDKNLGLFVNMVKYKMLKKKDPCNDTDLYTLDEYNKNNKNIYVIDIKNKKWWFTIETICKLICNNLSHFDSETHNVLCKEPINPFINNKFNIGQLIGIYEQLYKFKSVPNLFMLYRMANFNINQFLRIYNNDIINYSYKYKLIELDNESILTILHIMFNDNSIHYTTVEKLNLSNIPVRNDVIQLIKFCIIQTGNNKCEIRKFINKYNFILKKALRPNVNNLNSPIVINNGIELGSETDNDSDFDYYYTDDEQNLSETDLNIYDNGETYIIDTNPNNLSDTDENNLSDTEDNNLSDTEDNNNNFKIKAYMDGYIVRKRIRKLKNIIDKLKGYFIGYIERRKLKYGNTEDCSLIINIEKLQL